LNSKKPLFTVPRRKDAGWRRRGSREWEKTNNSPLHLGLSGRLAEETGLAAKRPNNPKTVEVMDSCRNRIGVHSAPLFLIRRQRLFFFLQKICFLVKSGSIFW